MQRIKIVAKGTPKERDIHFYNSETGVEIPELRMAGREVSLTIRPNEPIVAMIKVHVDLEIEAHEIKVSKVSWFDRLVERIKFKLALRRFRRIPIEKPFPPTNTGLIDGV